MRSSVERLWPFAEWPIAYLAVSFVRTIGCRIRAAGPHWRDYLVFSEYFHGDNGAGIGASHQTGWTGLVAKLIQQGAKATAESDPR